MSRNDVLEQGMPLDVGTRCVGMRIAWLARSHGVRALIIKGDTAQHQGLRDRAASTDVDVLVSPSDHDKMVAICQTIGWHRRIEAWSWGAFITHSVTLIREGWPCDLDMHRSFPGLFGDPAVTFDTLWDRRTTVGADDYPIDVPCVEDQLVILVAHALRSPDDPRSAVELEHFRWLVDRGDPVTPEQYRRAAERLGASVSTAEFLGGGPSSESFVPKAEQILWEEHRHAVRHTLDWFALIQEVDWRQRPRLVARALWPTRIDLVASYPGMAHSPLERGVLRAQRIGRAAGAFPRVVRSWRRSRAARRELRDAPAGQYGLALAENTRPTVPPNVRADGEASTAASHQENVERLPPDGSYVLSDSLQRFNSDGVEWAYDPTTDGRPLRLNESAAELMSLLEQPRTIAEVVDVIAVRYEMPAETVETHVSGFLASLLSLSVLKATSDCGADS